MRARLIFAFAFIGLFLLAVYWVSTWNDHTLDGRIERIEIPQLMIGPAETDMDEIKLHTILVNDQTEVTGLASDVQELRAGQHVTIELDPDATLNIALSIHVTSD
ncbi:MULTISPECIES: hypothetical protein [Exiguobacterium]|uniref:hypothetical protein n=1 Tax=Exiguobacterium TaxID=33986 RepID=UPI0008775C34|nr:MULTISPECIES: hypothetical protein [Exiguobacterium]OGX79339.1 hypothetical protein A6395_07425 [Exiguobacterium sp. SH31]TCI36562.1 hypothetical protein EVJ29_08770 [Exiguobacterium sp. SH4S7]TCI48614.1 hypothetical protein EVJ31_06175 [Exiguobacterium sp. SH5S32]TCI55500.1 hypothetical protein EVJ25_06165 [Exiguobacterium sp. SH1S4]TCI57797.1 hypothetical protein EVJ24_03230 [Exiguobacterium sp. SH1S21]